MARLEDAQLQAEITSKLLKVTLNLISVLIFSPVIITFRKADSVTHNSFFFLQLSPSFFGIGFKYSQLSFTCLVATQRGPKSS